MRRPIRVTSLDERVYVARLWSARFREMNAESAPRLSQDLIWKQILFRERNRSIGERDSADANVHGVASVFFDIFARALWARRPAENDGASPRKELAMAGKTSP
jgi:hypothetical protein